MPHLWRMRSRFRSTVSESPANASVGRDLKRQIFGDKCIMYASGRLIICKKPLLFDWV